MLSHSILGTRIKRLFAHVISVIALCILAASGARAQTTWKVVVDVTTPNSFNQNLPTYTVSGSGPNGAAAYTCDAAHPSQPTIPNTNNALYTGDLYVCGGDTVIWQYKANSNSNNVVGDLLIVDRDGIFISNTGDSPHWFHAPPSGTPTANTLSVTVDVASTGSHKITIAVHDPTLSPTNRLYVHDPQIIIGTGGT